MTALKKLIKRYRAFLLILCVLAALLGFSPESGQRAAVSALNGLAGMLKLLPPVFVILGLLDVWLPRETMARLLGDGSGLTGIIIAFMFGSLAAGPLYAAFPVAMFLLRKGCSFFNLMVFMGAWSATKLPMMLYEISSMGARFAFTRLGLNVIGVLVIATLMNVLTPERDKAAVVQKAETES